MGTWLLVGLATCLVLASEAGGAGATRLRGDPPPSQHPAHAHTLSSPCPHPAASAEPTTKSLLKADYEIITELPKPKPGFYLNKQFQQKEAAATSRADVEAREKVFETKVGSFKLSEPRKPKPGYYLNRQFQKKTQIAKNEVKKIPRKVVDDSGRYWTVTELPEPEAGYYLNKQFQRQRVFPVEDSSVKADAKVEVFLLTSTEVPPAKVPHTTLPLVTESPAINFGHTASAGSSRDVNFYSVFSVPETPSSSSFGDVQQPLARPRPQQVPSREDAKASVRSCGESSSAPEDSNKAPEIRTGFGPPSTLADLLLREDESAKLDTESPAVTAQQPLRQRPQTEHSQRQRPQRRQHQLRAQTEKQERQRPQRRRQQQRARAEQQHRQRAQAEPQRRQRVQQQRQRTQEEQQPRERAQPQRQRAQQLRLRAQQLRQRIRDEQQERQRAQEEQQGRQRSQKEQQERQRAQAEQQERQKAQEEQQKRLKAQAEQQERQKAQAEQEERRRAQAEQQERQRAQAEQEERRRAQAEQQERQRAQAERRERQRAQAEQQERRKAQEEQQKRLKAQAEQQERQKAQAEQEERRRAQAEQQQERQRPEERRQQQRQRPEERRQQQRTQTERKTSGFSCEGRGYGYYPDVENDCQGYHICNPIPMGGNNVQFHKYSFQCSPGMKWHQGSMACVAASSGDHLCQLDDPVH